MALFQSEAAEGAMSRRRFLGRMAAASAVASATLAVSSSLWAAEAPKERPNVLLIIGDDISIDDFGCYGHPHIRTPNIDELARTGMRFTRAYLTASQCSPTRCCLISGRYPHNTGAPELHLPLPPGQPMFPLEMKNAGYYTAAVGKWHMGDYPHEAFDDVADSRPGGEERWVEFLRNRPRDKPFFMWLASHDAHRSWQEDPNAPKHEPSDAVIPPYMADMPGTREDLAAYYDEIQRLDRYTGDVIAELKQQGVYENTIIIFMADNGRPFPRCKVWLYDGGIKTPFIVSWPGGAIPAGSVSDSLISAVDVGPTVLDLVGLPAPEMMQGISFRPILADPEATTCQYAFAEQNWHDMQIHQRMVTWKNFVYIRNARPQLAAWAYAHHAMPSYQDLFALQTEGKLTEAQANVLQAPQPAERLFDTAADVDQLRNLVDDPAHAEVLEHLRQMLDQWQDRTGDTVPEHLTPDGIDRQTLQWVVKPQEIQRGTIPGSERHATAISDPGPR